MPLSNRYDFALLFDVRDGNPNGDPDAGNLPRLDAESGHGLVTDVALKRKVRNFVGMVMEEQPPYEIYIKERAVLNRTNERAYLGIDEEAEPGGKRRPNSDPAVEKARLWMCKNFFDVRAFGAVMSTKVNCGQVRGPIQLTFARSVEPIAALEYTITRMAATDSEDRKKREKAETAEAEGGYGENQTMGRKHTVPYGVYVAHGFISAFLAKQTGFSEEDLELFWQALSQMFEHDRSAARGEMATRGLYVFKHDSELGNAHAHALFDRIKVSRKEGVEVPRSFTDYKVTVDESNMPAGVTLENKLV